MPRPPALPPSSVNSRVMVCCGLPTQRNNISGVGKVQPHMSCAAEGRLCEVRPIPHGLYSSQPRDQRPAIPLPPSSPPLNHHQSIKNAHPLICIPVNIVFANGPSENTACMLSSVSICLLWFESSSVTVMETTKLYFVYMWSWFFWNSEHSVFRTLQYEAYSALSLRMGSMGCTWPRKKAM